MFDVIIPWRDLGDDYRRKNFEFISAYYATFANVIIGNDNDGEFTRAVARNNGVSQSTADIVAVIDSDVYIHEDQLLAAIELASNVDVLVKPFTEFGYMDLESTNLFYDGTAIDKANFSYNLTFDKPAGGAFVIKRDLWNQVGGMDERFVGWGGEAEAFNIKCNELLGETQHVDGFAFHLFHPTARNANTGNLELLAEMQ